MIQFDIEAIRARIRAMDFTRGTLAEVARWNEADENARADLAIEDMALEPNEAALFKLFRDEAVPPDLATQIALRLMDHPDAPTGPYVAGTAASDFAFADLKDRPGTVFLCLPPDRLDTYARWLRLLIAQAVTDMARSPARPTRPVLFLLDEFAALGRLEPVERAMGLMAGYGLQLWPILQDLHQLRATYGDKASTFMSNAGVLQAFGVNDHATAELLSKTIGQTTLEYQTAGTSERTNIFKPADRSRSTSTHVAARSLMTPDEIMRMPPGQQLLLLQGQDPLVVDKVRYYDGREFTGLADPA